VGRPKSRWEDYVRNGLKKMKLIKWTEQVQDSLKWKDIVKKAKTVPELQRHRRRKRYVNDHTLTINSTSEPVLFADDTCVII
jgi:hypothetical protein